MALNASLVLSGDAEGAERALRGVSTELERGEKGAEAYNRAFAATDATITKLANAQAAAKRENMQATAAYKAGEVSLEQYNRELLQTKTALGLVEAEHRQTAAALRQANQALGQAPGQTGAARAGYAQLGQQMQDVAVMAQGGANIGTIIATQGGQVATAVQMMGGRMSGFAGFLAGPWGTAVLVGASLLANLVTQMFMTEDAAGAAETKTFDFAAGLDVLELSAEDAADAMKQLEQDMRSAIAVQGDFLRQNALVAQSSVNSLKQRLAADNAELGRLKAARSGLGATLLPSLFGPRLRDRTREDELRQRMAADRTALGRAQSALVEGQIATAQQRVNEQLDAGTAATGRYKRAIGELEVQFEAANKDPLDGLVLSPEKYEAEYKRLTTLRDAEVEAARAADRKPRKTRERQSSADKEARELQRLTEWGDRAEESIARISERFGEQPTLVVQVNQAARQLDDTIADLEKRKPPGFAEMIADARVAQDVVQEALVRPFTELRQESERRQQVDLLLLAGKREQAAVVQEIWRLEERLGPLTREQREEVEAIVLAEQDHLELLEKAQETQLAYLDTTRGVRFELEAMLAGRGDIGNFQKMFRDLKARVMVEQIFGPALQELEDYVTENTALPDAVDVLTTETGRAGSAVASLADVVVREAQRIANPAAAASGPSPAFQAAFGGYEEAPPSVPGELIVVSAPSRTELTPEQYFERMTRSVTAPLLEGLNEIFGVEFFSQLQGAVSTAFYGYATAGTTGGVLGFAKGLVDDFGPTMFGPELGKIISQGTVDALAGAQRGTQVAGMAGMFGINMSNSGAQMGGALGSFLPIPGGDIIGSIAGGLLGGLFSKTKYGTATLTGSGNPRISGRGEGRSEGAGALGGSVQSALSRIAEQLDAEIGSYNVSIGTYKDDFRVSTSGKSGKLGGYKGSASENESKYGLYNFGGDEKAAIAFAISDAIGDGAIKGVSAAVQKALRSSPDIEAAMEEAVAVADLEAMLVDVGDAWRQELLEFEATAKERLDLARRYGIDLVKVEELNARERLALTEQLLEEQVGSLQDLIEQMTSGNLFEGSAVDRREALLGEIASARTAAQAGEEGAGDRLANLLRQLNEVSSEVYGSTGGFAADRDTILDTARDVIAAANQRIEGKSASDPALAETNASLDENNDQNAQIIGKLDDIRAGFQGLLEPRFRNTFDLMPLRELARTSV